VDMNKYNLKRDYLLSLLLDITPMEKKGYFVFPPFKPKEAKETIKQEVSYTVREIKRKKPKKSKRKEQSPKQKKILDFKEEEDDLGDFMLV
jgi:hypothetical protein